MFQRLIVVISIVNYVNSEVVNDPEFIKCNEFFYKRTPPSGFPTDNTQEICQRYQNNTYYATLYNTAERIPVYSAYRLDYDSCIGDQPDRRNTWFVEPQLSGTGYPLNMGTAGSLTDTYKRVQAINIDFRNTNFDRGHLNPNFYQCDAARTATFTLTNAIPQDPCFNQNMWKEMEKTSKNIMRDLCSFQGARRYFVTGAVPGLKKIPSRYQDEEGDATREYNRVNVPSYMWTAACCDSSAAADPYDRNKGFSFGYYGKNEPDSWVTPTEVSTMEGILSRMYALQVLDIFADSCFEGTEQSKNAIKKLRVPLNKRVADNVLDLSKSSESSVLPAKRKFVQKVDNVLGQNSAIVQRNWKFADGDIGLQSQRIQSQSIRHQLLAVGLTTVLTQPKLELTSKEENSIPLGGEDRKMISYANTNDILPGRKTKKELKTLREQYYVDTRQNTKEYFLKMKFGKSDKRNPKETGKSTIEMSKAKGSNFKTTITDTDFESTILDNYVVVPSSPSTWTGMGYRCRAGHSCDFYDKAYRWCYIDWNDNWDYCCTGSCGFGDEVYQWCHSGTTWAYCSLPYSTITISGKTCLQEHTCGRHEEEYFWCYTDTKLNWDYCCQPWHDCLSYNEDYKWCYTGFTKKQRWDKCYY